MNPKQLIDACRDTSHPMPSGKKVAEVLEMLLMQRDTLAQTFAETCAELGCAQDNEAVLMAIHVLRERIKDLEAYGKGMEEVYAELGNKTQVCAERLAAVAAERDELARQVVNNGYRQPWGYVVCSGCGGAKPVGEPCAHAPGCPVALAEEILKAEGK